MTFEDYYTLYQSKTHLDLCKLIERYKTYINMKEGSLDEIRSCLIDMRIACLELLEQTDLSLLWSYRFYANYSTCIVKEIVHIPVSAENKEDIEDYNDAWARNNWHEPNSGCSGRGWEYIGPKELTDKLIKPNL